MQNEFPECIQWHELTAKERDLVERALSLVAVQDESSGSAAPAKQDVVWLRESIVDAEPD